MRYRLFAILALVSLANVAVAKDVFLSIGGSVGVFRTDARIFNPSTSKDIQIQAYYLPVGNVNNSAAQPTTITVPKRQQLIYDDVVTSLFHGTGLGAVRLVSSDDFVATQRIYASSSSCPVGTLGQFVPGVEISGAKAQGLLIQLKSNGGAGQTGTFRTNIGAVNPGNTTANVTWRLYDKNNALVGNAKTMAMPPYAVIAPTSIGGFGDSVPASADFTDAWVSFSSDQPIIAYASVVDNGSTDPTYVPMSEDTGLSQQPPTTPTGKVFDVTTHSFAIDVSPQITGLAIGDTVTLRLTGHDRQHGFQLDDPTGKVLINILVDPDVAVVEKTFTITTNGQYNYFCTIKTCGDGHNSMVGSFQVGDNSGPGRPGYK